MSSGRKMFLVDQCLAGLNGHHLFYNRALAEAALEEGLETTVLAGRGFPTDHLAPCIARGVFRRDWRAAPPAWAGGSRLMLEALDRLSFQRFRRDLERTFRQTIWSPKDLVFGQMITPRHLAAWLEWISARPVGGAPTLAVHVAYDPSRFLAHARVQRALRVFHESPHRGKLLPLTDSSRLTLAYGALLDREVFILPHVISPLMGNLRPFPDARPPVFGILGSPRAEKGFAEVAQAVLDLSTTPDPPRFLVVTSEPDASSAPWVRKLREARLENVELVDEAFDNEAAYARLFEQVSALVLPYHLNIYGLRTSGVFCEALASGRAVVVSEGSWMSDKAGDGAACVRVPERDPVALASAIRAIVRDNTELSAQARRTAPLYREEFSARRFMSGLVQLAEEHA